MRLTSKTFGKAVSQPEGIATCWKMIGYSYLHVMHALNHHDCSSTDQTLRLGQIELTLMHNVYTLLIYTKYYYTKQFLKAEWHVHIWYTLVRRSLTKHGAWCCVQVGVYRNCIFIQSHVINSVTVLLIHSVLCLLQFHCYYIIIAFLFLARPVPFTNY